MARGEILQLNLMAKKTGRVKAGIQSSRSQKKEGEEKDGNGNKEHILPDNML